MSIPEAVSTRTFHHSFRLLPLSVSMGGAVRPDDPHVWTAPGYHIRKLGGKFITGSAYPSRFSVTSDQSPPPSRAKFCRDWFDLMWHPGQRQSVKSGRERVQHERLR